MRSSVNLVLVLLVLTTVTAVLTNVTPLQKVYAQVCTTEMQACNKGDPRTNTGTGQPEDPECWGEVSSQLAKTGTMGEHVSNPIPSDDDPDSPRLGLGNTVEGTPFDHGQTV